MSDGISGAAACSLESHVLTCFVCNYVQGDLKTVVFNTVVFKVITAIYDKKVFHR